jgi:hypothetical protein
LFETCIVGFFIVDFGLAQVNTWVNIKTVTEALLRAWFSVGDVVQIRRVMEKYNFSIYGSILSIFLVPC